MNTIEINQNPLTNPDLPANSRKDCGDDILGTVYIAAPCGVAWDELKGSETKRFCSDCKLNVYNISSMSATDARQLITSSEGRLCLTFYRRKDGTIITDNCPVGLRKIRDRMKKVAISVAFTCAWLGLISDASAQGLVGAPVDPGGWGTSRDVVQQAATKDLAMPTATLFSFALIGRNLFLRRTTFINTALLLAVLWTIAGIFYGFEGQAQYLTSNAVSIWLTVLNK
jgi:hypothetical protein